jgi:hypothetical protein
MPFKSQAQRGFMYAKHPKLAKEFEAATPKGEKLPYHVGKDGAGPLSKMFSGKGK